jgi:hypothetical protein
MTVPSGVQSAEYWAWPTSRREASFTATSSTSASASGPETWNSPMCDTSKSPAASRTARCSAWIPAAYCTGMDQPAKGTILPPRATCSASKGGAAIGGGRNGGLGHGIAVQGRSSWRRSAFWACRRFSASWKTRERGPSMTAAVTSSPRCAGRQCRKMASGCGAGEERLVHLEGREGGGRGPGLFLLPHRGPDVGGDHVAPSTASAGPA